MCSFLPSVFILGLGGTDCVYEWKELMYAKFSAMQVPYTHRTLLYKFIK